MIPHSIKQLPSQPRKPWAWIIGRLCITACNQAANSPFIDECTVSADNGRTYRGRCILLAPWRRDRHRQTRPQRAFVLAWGRSTVDLLRAEVETLKRRKAIAEEVARELQKALRNQRVAMQAQVAVADDDEIDPPVISPDGQMIEYDSHYQIELAEIRTPIELVQWLYHLSMKTWVKRDDLRTLMEFACRGRGWPMFLRSGELPPDASTAPKIP